MAEYSQIALLISATKVIQILVGLLFAYFGYSLFRLGVYEKAGELKAAWGERRLALKQAAPGTFFALFGALVIGVSIWRGIEVHVERPGYRLPPPISISEPRAPLITSSGNAPSSAVTAPKAGDVKTANKQEPGRLKQEDLKSAVAESFFEIPGRRLSLQAGDEEAMRLVQRLIAGEKLSPEELEKVRSWLRALEREKVWFLGYGGEWRQPDIRLRIEPRG